MFSDGDRAAAAGPRTLAGAASGGVCTDGARAVAAAAESVAASAAMPTDAPDRPALPAAPPLRLHVLTLPLAEAVLAAAAPGARSRGAARLSRILQGYGRAGCEEQWVRVRG